MPSRNDYLTYGIYALVVAAVFAAVVYPGLPFLTQRHWSFPCTVLGLFLGFRANARRRDARFRERSEFFCRVREVPGGGAGLSGRWRTATAIPYQHRLNITGKAAERPSGSAPGGGRTVEEGLVQLRNVVEMSRRDQSLLEALWFGPGRRIARYAADGAVVDILAPPRHLDGARAVVHGALPVA